MAKITQVISSIPTPPTSTDRANFRVRADTFLSALPNLSDELNNFSSQANALRDEVNTFQQDTETAKNSSVAAANFKGEWSNLSGSLSIPSSVSHNGVIWVLNKNLTDVAASEPSSSNTDWIEYPLDAKTLDGLDSSAFAKLNGDNTQTFKVANAVNDDEALSKGQLLSEIQAVDGSGSGLDADKVDGIDANLLGIGGAGYQWVDETNNRTAGTTYTNTTGHPIMVAIKYITSAGTTNYLTIDGLSNIIPASTVTSANYVSGLTVIIPIGSTYSLTNNEISTLYWYELK